jgi:hypothetical protein
MRSRALSFLLTLLAAAITLPRFAQATEVDLKLVLAVDVSPSMDADELAVQRGGYVAAFRHQDVLAAILSGPLGRIAVTHVEWSGPQNQATVVPWTLIDSEEAAQAFATQLSASTPNRTRGTSISAGLLFAATTFGNTEFSSARQVIDISGDGPNNRGVPVEPVRSGIVDAGVTINGLPIVVKANVGRYALINLDDYYEDCVIGGPGAFLIPVHDMSQLASAIRRKLLLEIVGLQPQILQASETRSGPRVDCLIGEKRIQRWQEK